jgi:hypothetical protein
MEVDDDASHPRETTSSSFASKTKKDKGKAKASEILIRQQEVAETEESLDRVLRRLEDAGVDREVARFAIDDEAAQTVVERLLARIDMLRDELRQSERARIWEEDEKLRLRDEVLRIKEERRREDSSRHDDEERYRKKRKER